MSTVIIKVAAPHNTSTTSKENVKEGSLSLMYHKKAQDFKV